MFKIIGGFVLKHLPAIILAALIAIIAWQFYSITSERDKAIKDYTELKHALDIAKAENTGKLAELKAEGFRNKADQDKQHIADIQHIGTQYGRVINNDKATINRYRADISDKLRQQQAANSGNGMPKDDAGGLAGDDGNPAAIRLEEESPGFYKQAYSGAQQYIETLEQAGAVCAVDYNRCYAYAKSEQGRLGVESSDVIE
ncbi:hypothetical protein ACFQ2T_04835 [Methylophilus flavus]|uniref:DUF2514 family protein n=1 Tax=Methylophilus flavus TaxID=640084 RepID=A0ABW3P9F9_9PROT